MHNGNRQTGLFAQQERKILHGRAGKMLVPLLTVLAVISMIGVGAVGYVLQQEREKRQATERELHQALAESEDLKGRLDDLQQSKTKIEEELGRIRKEYASAQAELAKAVESREALSKSVEDREREIGRLTRDLEQVRTESKQASGQLTELQGERETMKKQLADLEHAKSDLEAKVLELSSRPTVELDKVLVTNDKGQPGSPVPVSATTGSGREGQVVVINREYDFIVMNLGKNHGLSVGQEFQVVRGAEVLGKVKVEKVYDELSAAAILPDSHKDAIKEGDAVKAL